MTTRSDTGDAAAGGSPKSVILTVDDVPGVFRSVARDLRRRYGSGHRIVRAESGADALDAINVVDLDHYFLKCPGRWSEGPALPDPQAHPADQPTPGPAGTVPRDWMRHLH